jgi:CRISPR-associated protein Cas6
MYWQEETEVGQFVVPDDIIDLVFAITCRTLPVDHAQALYRAVTGALPWLADEPDAGIHAIHGADSGNGWERPDDLLLLSRRTKLVLRLPKARADAARALSGQRLDVAGHTMDVGEASPRLLSKTTTLYARYVSFGGPQREDAFLRECFARLRESGVSARKILCGKTNTLHTDDGPLETRSLMVAELSLEDSVRLQERGIGEHRRMGCGLFIAHKSV